MDYSIGEFSKATGLGIHTLRYYEHENLIIPLRNSSNRRRYSEKDIAWIAFIKRLKATGMPIKEIKKICGVTGQRGCHSFRTYGNVDAAPPISE